MSYKVFLTKKAEKDFDSLSRQKQKTLFKLLQSLEKFPNCTNLKKLQKPLSGYRLKSGECRLLFTVSKKEIIIYKIKHRKDAYK